MRASITSLVRQGVRAACSESARIVLALAVACVPTAAMAQAPAHDLMVLGLFRDKAVLTIDGVRRVLGIGQRSPEGVKLIEADSRRAILEIAGQRKPYRLGTRVSTAFAVRETRTVSIYRAGNGLFATVGSINGLPVNFLVDTGASAVALNAAEAKRLGIAYRLDGVESRVRTASGMARAYSVKVDRVNVGGIVLRDVAAFVIEGAEPSTALLGMSYLRRLEISHRGDVMVLEKAH